MSIWHKCITFATFFGKTVRLAKFLLGKLILWIKNKNKIWIQKKKKRWLKSWMWKKQRIRRKNNRKTIRQKRPLPWLMRSNSKRSWKMLRLSSRSKRTNICACPLSLTITANVPWRRRQNWFWMVAKRASAAFCRWSTTLNVPSKRWKLPKT